MKERTTAIIITAVLVILGLIIGLISSLFYIVIFSGSSIAPYTEFNFYKSELDINGTHVKETLYFNTNQPYHTLFRNFESTITSKSNPNVINSVIINSVQCQAGNPYFKISSYCYKNPDFTSKMSCPAYTEDNEYGCTFGDVYGFSQGQTYWISSDLTLNPENLFEINGKYYIKFIAYGRDNHISLTTNNNLIINGDAIYTNQYDSNKYTIIYIPYSGDASTYKIQKQSDFLYDTTNKISSITIILIFIGVILLHMLPAILFFCSWFFFGKELTDEEVPDQLSQYPQKRKPWEVAAFFNPPFGKINRDFFSTMFLDFYRRKIIDLKPVKGFLKQELMIKINDKSKETLDNIEKQFLNILLELKKYCSDDEKGKDYFNLNKSGKSYSAQISLSSDYMDFQKSLDGESKKYLEKKGIVFFSVSMVIITLFSFIFIIGLAILSIISLVIVLIISATTSLLIRYKDNFYTEYQEWQSFKKWLKYSPAMKETGTKGVILWDEYLVYATALGVSKEVLKELKKEGLIDDKRYNFYKNSYVATYSFSTSSAGGHGGGGGGGGGVGGGGGGGR